MLRISFIIFFLISFDVFETDAQKRNKNISVASDTVRLDSAWESSFFTNINKKSEFFDPEAYKQISSLHQSKQWVALKPILESYVSQFGIRNFYKDTHLIWKLAKIEELIGSNEKAKRLYRLALRHHHTGIDLKEVELYYDTLNNQKTKEYVPIEYYYELVEHRKAIDTLLPPKGVLLNMGPKINSPYADYGPAMGGEIPVLLFTTKRNQVNQGLEKIANEDIFYSKLTDKGWLPAEDLALINTRYNEGSACLSKDGKKIYFSRCYAPGSVGNCDLYVSELLPDSTWGAVTNLGVQVNSVGWDSHPSLSHTEDTLFFASDRMGGFGMSDIYFAVKTKDGWGNVQNCGPVINTRQNDVSPFYHPTHHVLYFSSNGQLYNFGEFDIYKAYFQQGKWSEPYNIGPLVNGRGSEFYFTIHAKSENLYYARSTSRDLNKLDLYSFPLPMEGRPESMVKISGSLTDELTGKPFTGIVSVIDMDQGVEVAPKYLKADGSFEFDLLDERNYLLVIQGDDFFRIEEMFYLKGPMEFNKTTAPISSRVKFESIEFNTGEAGLKTEMYADLNKLINFMYDHVDFYLKIEGHTDSFGAEEVNLRLSEERAKNIHDYIVIFGGVEEHRVSYKGYGSSKPIVEDVNDDAKAWNRRVEFEIYRPEQ